VLPPQQTGLSSNIFLTLFSHTFSLKRCSRRAPLQWHHTQFVPYSHSLSPLHFLDLPFSDHAIFSLHLWISAFLSWPMLYHATLTSSIHADTVTVSCCIVWSSRQVKLLALFFFLFVYLSLLHFPFLDLLSSSSKSSSFLIHFSPLLSLSQSSIRIKKKELYCWLSIHPIGWTEVFYSLKFRFNYIRWFFQSYFNSSEVICCDVFNEEWSGAPVDCTESVSVTQFCIYVMIMG
jgi:hypothetical protein